MTFTSASGTLDRKALLHSKMDESRAELIATLEAIQPDQLELPTDNTEWTVWDLAAHIASAEGGMIVIGERILAGQQDSVIEGFDVNRYNAGNIKRRKGRSVVDLIEELNTSRTRMNALLEGATEIDLDKTGQHPTAGLISLYGLFVVIYRHERQHTAELRQALGL